MIVSDLCIRRCGRRGRSGWARGLASALLLSAGAWVAAPCHAQPAWPEQLRFGLLAHDVRLFGQHIEHGSDVNLELLWASPAALRVIGAPRPTLGGDFSVAGQTSDLYGALTWAIPLPRVLRSDGLFADGALGGAVNDGYVDAAPPARKALGSRVLFHLSIELGYRFDSRLSIAAFVDHMSNANLARRNAGITDAGARIGIRF